MHAAGRGNIEDDLQVYQGMWLLVSISVFIIRLLDQDRRRKYLSLEGLWNGGLMCSMGASDKDIKLCHLGQNVRGTRCIEGREGNQH